MTFLARLRRFWLDVHFWLGVGLLIAMIPIGFSGSVLVWHDQIDPYVHPQRYNVSEGPAVPLSAHLEAARGAVGERFTPTQLRMPEHEGHPVIVSARAKGRTPEGQRPQTRSVFLDPATARVLDVANTRAEFWGVMHVLHGSLYIPEVGRKVVGWLGWGLFISSLTGLWLWWPRNNGVFKALRWRRSPSTNFNLHHLFGFWIAIPLAIVAITGVYISFPQTSRALTAQFLPMSEQGPRPGGGGGPGGGAPLERTLLSVDEAVAAALAAAPGGELASVSLPTRGREGQSPSWRVGVRLPEETRPATITIDDATREAKLPEARREAAGDGVPLLMRRIHDGVEQHIIWQVLVFLTGLAPAILGITGIVMWLRRSARRRALKRASPSASAT